MEEKDFQRQISAHLLQRLLRIKEFENAWVKLCLAAIDGTLTPEQTVIQIYELQKLTTVGAINTQVPASMDNHLRPASVYRLLYQRAMDLKGKSTTKSDTDIEVNRWLRHIRTEHSDKLRKARNEAP